LNKEAKNFHFLRQRFDPGPGRQRAAGAELKVFCFFSSEKKALLVFL